MTARNDAGGAGPTEPALDPTAVLPVIVERVPGMLAYWDSNLRCRHGNRAYEKWFGR